MIGGKKVHYQCATEWEGAMYESAEIHIPLCDATAGRFLNNVRMTTNESQVTCKLCQRMLGMEVRSER